MLNSNTLPALLLVPGNKPDEFSKAELVGANGVIIDLENTVSLNEKYQARKNALNYLSTNPAIRFTRILKINSLAREDGLLDLLAITSHSKLNFDAILYPNTNTSAELKIIDDILKETKNHVPVIASIESLNALENIKEIIYKSNNLMGIVFDSMKICMRLNCKRNFQSLLYSRSKVIEAAAGKNIPVYDMPFPDSSDELGLIGESSGAKDLGFSGKVAIDPKQIPVIKSIFESKN